MGSGVTISAVLIGLLRSESVCEGLACSTATFGGRPVLTLVFAVLGTAGLLVSALFTRGLTRVGARQLWQVVPAGVVTAASVIGAVVVLVVAVLIVLAASFAAFVVFALIGDRK